MVASLDDPYSHYYDPSAYQGFLNESNPHLSGIGVDVHRRVARAAGRGRVPGIARPPSAGLVRGRPDRRRRRHLAGQPAGHFGSRLIKGKAGTPVTLTVLSGSRKHVVRLVRQDLVVPVATGTIVTYHGIKLGSLALASFTERLGRRAARAGREGAPPGRARADPRPARQPGRAAQRGGQRRLDLHPRRHDRLDRGPGPAAPGLRRQGRRDPDQHPDGGAGRSRHRLRGGDRHRRAARSRAGQGRSARTPTARASSRRSSRCPTAARSTSRSGSTSPRAGTTSGAAGCARAPGSRPTSTPSRSPAPPATPRSWSRSGRWPPRCGERRRSAPAAGVAARRRPGRWTASGGTRAPRQVHGRRAVLRAGPAAVVSRDRRASVGDLIVVRAGRLGATAGRAGGRRSHAAWAAPTSRAM